MPGVAFAGPVAFVCGEPVEFSDDLPLVDDGRVYVLLRFISSVLGLHVNWDGRAAIEGGNLKVLIPNGQKDAVVIQNGQPVTIPLDAPVKLGVTPDVRALISQHHERAGGGGYPRNLAEPRPYRPEPLPKFEALREAAKVGVPEVVIRLLENKETVGNSQYAANNK